MSALILLLLLSIVPQPDGIYRDRVDVIEVNHLYGDDDGKWYMDQIIFWEWKGNRHEVVDEYRQARKVGYPERDWRRGGYRLIWIENQSIREVRAISTRETWTLNRDDPEKAERDHLPVEDRRKFQKIPEPKPFVRKYPPEPPPDNAD